MKKLSILLAVVFGATLNLSAQHARQIVSPELTPQTTVTVRVTIESETTTPGPYSRYSQRYLGTIAPLSDKTIYTITKATMDYTDTDKKPAPAAGPGPEAHKPPMRHASHTGSKSEFPKVRIDRVTSSEKSNEEMARDAAEMIFKLRRSRLELITGEAGENVFGDGLHAALKEIERLEEEYLSLFLGKKQIVTEVRHFDVVPQAGRNNYVVFRFSQTDGVMAAEDLSSDPVVLNLNPENSVVVDAKARGTYFAIADYANATLEYDSKVLAKNRIPVFQFGKVTQIPTVK